MLDRGEERELDRLSSDDGVPRLQTLVEQKVGVRLQPGKVGRWLRARGELGGGAGLERHDAARPPLEEPQAGVRRDPVEPGAESGLAPVSRPPGPRSQEGLLERVLRVLERAEHPVGVNLKLAAIALDELRERSLVSGGRRADDPLLDLRRRGHPLRSRSATLDPTAAPLM